MMEKQDGEIETPAKMRHIYNVLTAISQSFGSSFEMGLDKVRSWFRVFLRTSGTMLGVLLALGLTLTGCGDRSETPVTSIPLDVPSKTATMTATRALPAIQEVSPPSLIQALRSRFDRYRPQVSIVSPAFDRVIDSDTVTVQLNVTGLPLFRDERFGLGPHLQLLLDDQPKPLIFDANEPIILTDLAPGTHTLRAFAVRPWSESFKNDGAFAQTTFHVYTKTGKNAADRSRPLLTYNQPSGTYGAEPILLDFYLTNAPLHAIAQEFDDDAIRDWRVRATLNGQSFMVDRWEPLYLKGVKPGQNWLQIELIDELGEPIENAFNSTVRLFNYDPSLNDGLAELVRGAVSLDEALSVVGIEPVIEVPEETPEEVLEEAPIESSIEVPTEAELEEGLDEEIESESVESSENETDQEILILDVLQTDSPEEPELEAETLLETDESTLLETDEPALDVFDQSLTSEPDSLVKPEILEDIAPEAITPDITESLETDATKSSKTPETSENTAIELELSEEPAQKLDDQPIEELDLSSAEADSEETESAKPVESIAPTETSDSLESLITSMEPDEMSSVDRSVDGSVEDVEDVEESDTALTPVME